MILSSSLKINIQTAKNIFPIGTSFDFITRELYLGNTKAYFLGINGMCRTDLLQQIFSDLQNPLYMMDASIENLQRYMNSKIGYAQVSLISDWDTLTRNILSGPSVLFLDGFAQAILLDVRTYPARGIEEPEEEKVTRGSRDGFVETLLFNANLIRRRIRSPKLTFSIISVGAESKTDVAVAYVGDRVNTALLNTVKEALNRLNVTALTMGSKSLEELLVPKRWYNPLPSIQVTERPDVACSYLLEGHILLLVDNSPVVLILPGTIFQFTQSPEDYYKNPLTGSYFRMVRFGCLFASLLLTPVFLLFAVYFPDFSAKYQLIADTSHPIRLIFYVLAVEFFLDLFKYSASLSSGNYAASLSIVGGLIIGDVAIELHWASLEVLFYGAATLLAALTISSTDFSDALRIYRLFLTLATGFFGLWGFGAGLLLILISVLTTPTFAGMSYFWPLYPFNWEALKTLLFRYPTVKAQPSRVWNRGNPLN